MFVTGEEKPDWWHRSSDGPLYPRYELLEEFRRASKGKTFHIMNFAELLEQSGAEKVVVEEVRREQVLVAKPPLSNRGGLWAEHLVKRWASAFGKTVDEATDFPDFWVLTEESLMGVDVRRVGVISRLAAKLEDSRRRSKHVRLHNKQHFMTVFVASSVDEAKSVEAQLRQYVLEQSWRPTRLEIVVGYSTKTDFQQTSRFTPRKIIPPAS